MRVLDDNRAVVSGYLHFGIAVGSLAVSRPMSLQPQIIYVVFSRSEMRVSVSPVSQTIRMCNLKAISGIESNITG